METTPEEREAEILAEFKAAIRDLATAEKHFNKVVAAAQEDMKPAQERYRNAVTAMNNMALEDK